MSKLDADSLRVKDYRGQTYDNVAVMAGRRTGVQTRIRKKNFRALYVPCDSHSLNLVGVYAAHVDPMMVTYFGTIERIFTLFASSTHRWEVMKQHVELAIKRDGNTRWSLKCDALEAVCMQIDSVVDALEHLQDNTCKNSDTRADVGILFRNILTYNFHVLMPFWRSVLQAISRIQKKLQDRQDRQNPLSHNGQTRKRRRVRTPPVENVGCGRVVSSLYARLQIDLNLNPNPNPYTGSVLINRKNMPFCTNYFVQVISLKLDKRPGGMGHELPKYLNHTYIALSTSVLGYICETRSY